jgi:mono/diheme cytochrome c family protein
VDEEQKKQYQTNYLQAKQKGVKFWPDIIYKDLIVSFGFFMLLIGLAIFVGVSKEAPADPNDTSYIPRPEWYFLFLFEFLKYIPGAVEWVGTTVIPGIAVLILLLLPFLDKNPKRHWRSRKVGIAVMSLIVVGMVALTIVAVLTTPPQPETALAGSLTEQIVLGQDLYSIYCTECHGPDGEGGIIEGVEGMEGVELKSISSVDEMWTRTDETLFQVVAFGQQDLGMQPFGLAYGGELKKGEIDAIVAFMRYTWDERAEIPEEAIQGIPSLAAGEVPSYEVHISAIVKRYCVSCHRPDKENDNYLMQTYLEMLTTGDNAPHNLIAGDPENSYVIRTMLRESIFDDAGNEIIGPMPPSKEIKEEYIHIFEQWILNGMPETSEAAAALSQPVTLETVEPVEGSTPTP